MDDKAGKPAEYLDYDKEEGKCFVTLKSGVEVAGAKVKVIVMREPDVGDQLSAQKSGGDAGDVETRMIGNLCELSPDEMKSVKLRDYKRLQNAFVGFTD